MGILTHAVKKKRKKRKVTLAFAVALPIDGLALEPIEPPTEEVNSLSAAWSSSHFHGSLSKALKQTWPKYHLAISTGMQIVFYPKFQEWQFRIFNDWFNPSQDGLILKSIANVTSQWDDALPDFLLWV